MNERELRGLIGQVKAGRLVPPRLRAAHDGGGADGADGDPAAGLLGRGAWRSRRPTYKPTKRGGGGPLKVLWWQGPTLLNPHFAVGTKDQDGSRLFYEPLAGWDADGNLQPVLPRRSRAARTAASPPTASR